MLRLQHAERWTRGVVVSAVIGLSIAMLILATRGPLFGDVDAYWNAAMRLRDGQALYAISQDPGAPDVYRYAPWFAYAWVPLTLLPRGVVTGAWALLSVGSSIGVSLEIARQRSLAAYLLASLFGSLLLWTATRGNVQPLMILALAVGVPRRSGPIWVAVAASLKAVPIIFVLVFVAERRWTAAAWAVVLAAALVAPMLFLGWMPIDPAPSLSLFYLASPLVWGLVTAASVIACLILGLQRSNYTATVAGLVAVLALPRLLVYDISFLAPPAVWREMER